MSSSLCAVGHSATNHHPAPSAIASPPRSKHTNDDHLVRELSLELLRAVIQNQCEHLVQTDARDTEDPKPVTRGCIADGVRRTRPLHEHHPPQSVSHFLSMAVEHSRRH